VLRINSHVKCQFGISLSFIVTKLLHFSYNHIVISHIHMQMCTEQKVHCVCAAEKYAVIQTK